MYIFMVTFFVTKVHPPTPILPNKPSIVHLIEYKGRAREKACSSPPSKAEQCKFASFLLPEMNFSYKNVMLVNSLTTVLNNFGNILENCSKAVFPLNLAVFLCFWLMQFWSLAIISSPLLLLYCFSTKFLKLLHFRSTGFVLTFARIWIGILRVSDKGWYYLVFQVKLNFLWFCHFE